MNVLVDKIVDVLRETRPSADAPEAVIEQWGRDVRAVLPTVLDYGAGRRQWGFCPWTEPVLLQLIGYHDYFDSHGRRHASQKASGSQQASRV